MNTNSAYLLGMVLGNGEIQAGPVETNITIEIPYKNLRTDNDNDVEIYVKASLLDISNYISDVIAPAKLTYTSGKHSTQVSFTLNNNHTFITIIGEYILEGFKQQNFIISPAIFDLSRDYIRSLLKGFADVTGYIRRSNIAFGATAQHRVYLEIPKNWEMVISIANLLKIVDVPIQTIDFAHPNLRDGKLKKYNAGNHNFWKKEHQIKIWANEFLPIGFNIRHKEEALQNYANELLTQSKLTPEKTHLFYWEKRIVLRTKPPHPGENDQSLPEQIRGNHYESWTTLAKDLGYHE
ncbi:hypothetical protein [Lactobacillus johnsonii]|uniref:hypothetical protein n=1 Tax=Lactobacillus johnsonii TaxID=33959 RepID=UPI0019AD96A5|nr:hypothetical protein [Enterococcus sp.]